jgi:hypothetical protein
LYREREKRKWIVGWQDDEQIPGIWWVDAVLFLLNFATNKFNAIWYQCLTFVTSWPCCMELTTSALFKNYTKKFQSKPSFYLSHLFFFFFFLSSFFSPSIGWDSTL